MMCSIGLKYLVKEMPSAKVGPSVVRKLTPRLIAGISNVITPPVHLVWRRMCALSLSLWGPA